MQIQPVIVIYNKECSDSISVMTTLWQGYKPIVVDNSTTPNGNAAFCIRKDLLYISMGGNAGLSKAYNRAIREISNNIDYILWLDDDTVLPNNYFNDLEREIDENGTFLVYIPIVKSDRKEKEILSPSLFQEGYTYRINKINEISNKEFSGINSGMLVDRTLYKHYEYDENLFLDCIDHDFMTYCWKQGIPIKVISDIVLFQNFSGDEKKSKNSKLSRYKIFSKDFRYFRRKYNYSWFSTEIILLKRLASILFR